MTPNLLVHPIATREHTSEPDSNQSEQLTELSELKTKLQGLWQVQQSISACLKHPHREELYDDLQGKRDAVEAEMDYLASQISTLEGGKDL